MQRTVARSRNPWIIPGSLLLIVMVVLLGWFFLGRNMDPTKKALSQAMMHLDDADGYPGSFVKGQRALKAIVSETGLLEVRYAMALNRFETFLVAWASEDPELAEGVGAVLGIKLEEGIRSNPGYQMALQLITEEFEGIKRKKGSDRFKNLDQMTELSSALRSLLYIERDKVYSRVAQLEDYDLKLSYLADIIVLGSFFPGKDEKRDWRQTIVSSFGFTCPQTIRQLVSILCIPDPDSHVPGQCSLDYDRVDDKRREAARELLEDKCLPLLPDNSSMSAGLNKSFQDRLARLADNKTTAGHLLGPQVRLWRDSLQHELEQIELLFLTR